MQFTEVVDRLGHLAVRQEQAAEQGNYQRSYTKDAEALREAIRMLDAYATERLAP